MEDDGLRWRYRSPFSSRITSPAKMTIDRDFHMHTDMSTCASREATMARMVDSARAAGAKYIGISDHFHELNRDFAEMATTNRRLIEEATRRVDAELFLGCEAQMDTPTRCTINADLARRFDYVMCSCNHYHLRQVENPADKSPAGYARHYLQMVEGAIDTGFVDVIVHPFLHDKVNHVDHRAILDAYDPVELERVLRKAAGCGVAFELNPGLAIRASDCFRALFAQIRSYGGKISLGSDSHAPQELGYNREDSLGERFSWEDLAQTFRLERSDLYLPVQE